MVEEFVVLIDNGRSQWLGNEFHEMLRCIRCGLPEPLPGVESVVTYGWVYPGPMGSVLTPLMRGLKRANICLMHAR